MAEETGEKTALEIPVNIRKSARENASDYFERAKKLSGKITRARELLEREKLATIGNSDKKQGKEKGAGRKKAWHEGKFRSFFSSEGNLVLSGRDARTNEDLVKKHVGKDDTIFHADPSGSPFVVIKGPCSEKTLSEAATFCASYSRAWQARLGSIDVYWVRPEQVTKRALPGEYVPKGAFMIYGQKNYFKNTVLSVGIFLDSDGVPRSAPPSACPAGAKTAMIIPGGKKREDAVKEIKGHIGFGGRDDEIDSLIPPGKCEIARLGKGE